MGNPWLTRHSPFAEGWNPLDTPWKTRGIGIGGMTFPKVLGGAIGVIKIGYSHGERIPTNYNL